MAHPEERTSMQEVSLMTQPWFPIPGSSGPGLLVRILNQLFLQLPGQLQGRPTSPVTPGVPVDVTFFGYRVADGRHQGSIQGWRRGLQWWPLETGWVLANPMTAFELLWAPTTQESRSLLPRGRTRQMIRGLGIFPLFPQVLRR